MEQQEHHEQQERPELKWVSENETYEEEEEEEVMGLQARRPRNSHGQNGDSNGGSTVTSDSNSPGSVASESKNGGESGFHFSDEDGGFESVVNHEGVEAELKNSDSVYFDREQGTESVNEFSEIKLNAVDSFPIESNLGLDKFDATTKDFGVQKNLISEVEHQVVNYLGVESFSEIKSNGVKSFPIETNLGLEKFDATTKDFGIQKNPVNEIKHQGVEFLEVENDNMGVEEVVDFVEEEIDLEAPDLDVEGIIAKQETHDLFCPNCHSCITKRVILRRKKTKVRTRRRRARAEPTDNSPMEVVPELNVSTREHDIVDDQGDGRVESGSNDGPTSGNNRDREETDCFRCLSCFSFFIPAGNGFFRIFRGKNEAEAEAEAETATIQNPRDVPAAAAPANTNGFFSFFSSKKGTTSANETATAVEQENRTEADTVTQNNSSHPSDETLTNRVAEPPATPLAISTLGVTGQPAKAIEALQDGVNFAHSNGENLMNGKSDIKVDHVTDISLKYDILPGQNGIASTVNYVSAVAQPIYSNGVDGANEFQKVGKDISDSVIQVHKLPESAIVYVPEKLLDAVDQKMTGFNLNPISTETASEPAAPTQAQDIVVPREETSLQTEIHLDLGEPLLAQVSERRGWDILKSIVYGGLIESITSVGIVSSAAGAGAATLNIMVLALANLIGGLFIIAHNLGELRKDRSLVTSTETNETQDRYHELLGRREKFKLHAIVVFLSFLIFGALPPVIYGFSFRKSDDRDLKLAVVAASSLLCITLLATGKGHVQRPPKTYFKTVLYYLSIGFMASGASYLAGVLLDKLLNELGITESNFASSSSNLTFQEPSLGQRGWGEY